MLDNEESKLVTSRAWNRVKQDGNKLYAFVYR